MLPEPPYMYFQIHSDILDLNIQCESYKFELAWRWFGHYLPLSFKQNEPLQDSW